MQKLLFIIDMTPMGKRNISEELALAAMRTANSYNGYLNLQDDNYIKCLKVHFIGNNMKDVISQCEFINDPSNNIILTQPTKRVICIGIIEQKKIKDIHSQIIQATINKR